MQTLPPSSNEMPAGWDAVRLPNAVHQRLQELLDRQDAGQPLTPGEADEAQGLVDLAEWLSLVRLRSGRVVPTRASDVTQRTPVAV